MWLTLCLALLNHVYILGCGRLLVDDLHLQVVKHLSILQLLTDKLLGQDYVAQVGHQICVNSHLDLLGLRTEHIDQFDAHRFDIEGSVLAQVEENLQAIDVEEFSCELARTGRVVVAFVKQKNLEEFEHLDVETGTRLYRQALGNILNLGENLVSTTR